MCVSVTRAPASRTHGKFYIRSLGRGSTRILRALGGVLRKKCVLPKRLKLCARTLFIIQLDKTECALNIEWDNHLSSGATTREHTCSMRHEKKERTSSIRDNWYLCVFCSAAARCRRRRATENANALVRVYTTATAPVPFSAASQPHSSHYSARLWRRRRRRLRIHSPSLLFARVALPQHGN